ncbi:MAG: tripartite tricarboxylate transporter substrate binding protein [Clostridia bacterium]|nr:tripartite tricarboxylate transporter substrate binding protein [Clostridia bacterium]
MKKILALILTLVLTFAFASTALAAFPEKEVTIVVPFAAGGNVDLCCRIIADEMTKILGQQVIVDDRPGGGAIIGQTYALGQPADGYTMLALTSSFVTNILSGDTDFGMENATAIGQFCFDPEIVVVGVDSGITTIDEFMAAAKAGALTNSTPGFSTSHHIASLILTETFGLTPFAYMHTDGSAEQVVQLAGGHAQCGMTTYGGAATLIAEGKIIPLAVCNSERHQALPDVPTMAECGYDFVYGAYRGFAVPAGTPEDVVNTLSDALKQAMESEAVIKAFNDSGFPIMYLNAADYQKMLDEDYKNMEAIYYLLDEE